MELDYLDRIKGAGWRQEQAAAPKTALASRHRSYTYTTDEHRAGLKALRTRHPIIELAASICAENGQSLKDVLGTVKTQDIAATRQKIFYEARKQGHAISEIGRRMKRDHTTVSYGAKVHAVKNNLPPLTNYALRHEPKILDHKGENNPSSKLTAEQVKEIFVSRAPRRKLADKYGVSLSAVTDIRSGRNWRHITNDL